MGTLHIKSGIPLYKMRWGNPLVKKILIIYNCPRRSDVHSVYNISNNQSNGWWYFDILALDTFENCVTEVKHLPLGLVG